MENLIHQEIELRFPQKRVWSALTDWKEFGEWFRVKLDSPFVEGKESVGRILHPRMEHIEFNLLVETIEPESYFAYLWHPFAIDPEMDYAMEKPTLVEFHLAQSAKGTRLSLTETGFNHLPKARREQAYKMHVHGWAQQMRNITEYLQTHAS